MIKCADNKPRITSKTIVQSTHQQRQILRAAIYCRVSTAQEAQEGSFETQRDYFLSKITDDPKLELAGIYGDFGITGRTTDKRLEFKKMLKDCQEGKIDIIYAKNISRFARNFVDCMETLAMLKKIHVRVVFDENDIDTADTKSELLLNILAAIAEEESNSIGANMLWANEERAQRGVPLTVTPYAYHRESGDSEWSIVEAQAEIVRYAFQQAAEGVNLSALARKMNVIERDNETGRKWDRHSVRYMLSNINYIGDFLTGRRVKIGKKVKRNKGQREQYYIENHHPAIVERELFERVQMILEANKKRKAKTA